MKNLFDGVFNGLTVLLTGHTGFKGSWLTIWLKEMGANVVGYSLKEPPTDPSNYEITKVAQYITDIRGDIRDFDSLRQTVEQYRPDLVIHFAAQTTVLESYDQPKVSFDTNVTGTVNVLEAIRQVGTVRAVVVCATDKVYENREWVWGYRENDELGGYDPYSTSKAMAELAVNSYCRSFFSGEGEAPKLRTAIGSVRAGNVIGGGDFTQNGLLADAMRAIFKGEDIVLRNPSSTRPWQYVLEPLSGYLCLAARLLQDGQAYAQARNFGPLQHKAITTQEVAEKIVKFWEAGEQTRVVIEQIPDAAKVHEAHQLHLNWDKAASLLNWRPVYSLDEALSETMHWYKAYQQGQDMYEVCRTALQTYVRRAQELGLAWSQG